MDSYLIIDMKRTLTNNCKRILSLQNSNDKNKGKLISELLRHNEQIKDCLKDK